MAESGAERRAGALPQTPEFLSLPDAGTAALTKADRQGASGLGPGRSPALPELAVTPCQSVLAFPFRTYRGGNGNGSAAALCGDPAVAAGAADAAGVGKGAESVGDDLVADAKLLAQGR